MTDQHKIIIPLPPRFIVGKLQLGPLELAWDQVKVLLICTLFTTIVIGSGEGTAGLLLNFIELLIIWGLFYKYARTHDVLVESKIMLGHRIRKLKGLDKYSSVSSPDKHVSELYRFSIKSVSKTGIIDFGKNSFGVILGCDTRWLDDEELTRNIARVNGFLNSIQPGTLLKVRASSQIPYLNPVEKMVMKQVNQSRSPNEKALLYSLHDLSSRTPKTTDWNVKIFISMRSDPKEIETRMMTLIPGVKNRLQAAHTASAVITHSDKIYNILANDNTGYHVHANRTPALYGEKAIWKNILRQIMQGSIVENKDHLLVNNTEYISCLIVGIPIGDVSGFPPTLSPEILTQIYRLSASEEHVIRIDQSIFPINSPEALKEIKGAINLIKGNEQSLQHNQTARMDMGLDLEDLTALYAQIKDGRESMFNINFIITVFQTNNLHRRDPGRALCKVRNIPGRQKNLETRKTADLS